METIPVMFSTARGLKMCKKLLRSQPLLFTALALK